MREGGERVGRRKEEEEGRRTERGGEGRQARPKGDYSLNENFCSSRVI